MPQALDSLAKRLVYARERRGLTQHELAYQAEVTPSAIGNLEQGRSHTARKVVRIAKVLGVRPEWLETGELPMTPEIPTFDGKTITLMSKIERLSAPQYSIIAAAVDGFLAEPEPAPAPAPAPHKSKVTVK